MFMMAGTLARRLILPPGLLTDPGMVDLPTTA